MLQKLCFKKSAFLPNLTVAQKYQSIQNEIQFYATQPEIVKAVESLILK